MNITLFYFLNDLAFRSPVLDALIIFFATHFGTLLFAGVILFLVVEKYPKEHNPLRIIRLRLNKFAVIFVSVVGSWGVAGLLKEILTVPRPFLFLENVKLLFEHGGFDSFPSGHATFFAALAMALYYYNKKLGLIFGVSALIIGVSRVIAGVHFPVDIIAGFFIGIVGAWIVHLIAVKVAKLEQTL
ncbi:hypothetical protein COB64_03495 [Candidatus Wolfebacteria bacterium]|nr:MAG: hypothetical protein COB64_03495 [Candidatus Wolfebacteria bacterium]